MNKVRFYNKASSILLTVMLLILGIFIFWSVYPYKVVEIESPAEVITKELRSGDHLRYRLEGEIFKDSYMIELRRRMTNGVDHTMSMTHPPTPEVGKIDIIVGSNQIPTVLPGVYQMKFVAIHRINPIRTVEIKWETESFEVIE